jgi:ribosome-associated heat shock protein Hsp15
MKGRLIVADGQTPAITRSGVRLDKWLWAARFFKTRGKAKEAIEGGKVHINGARCKPSRDVSVDDQLSIRQGWVEKLVVVKQTSDQRRGAPEAAALYEETPESIEKRMLIAEQRRSAASIIRSDNRPDKRTRRLIHQFRDKNLR